MKVVATVVAAAALVLPAAQAAERKTAQPVLGLDYGNGGAVLAWFDPVTLTKLQRPEVAVGRYAGSGSFSSDRSMLAFAAADTTPPATPEWKLRFVSVGEMRVVGELDVGGAPDVITWLRPDRLLALVRGRSPQVVVVDPSSHALLRSVPLPASAGQAERVPGGIAVLLGSDEPFAPAVLAVVDADGGLRTVTLGRVSIGRVGFEERVPGFAVDRTHRRAFVVGADLTVAEVNLDTLAVKYHGGRTRALAKAAAGSIRQALWLGSGRLAISGDDRTWATAATHPVGLRLVETRNWRTRVVDRWIDHLEPAPKSKVFLAQSLSAAPWRIDVYGRGGTRRYRMIVVQRSFNVQGPYGYLCENDGTVVRVVDAASGRTLHVPTRPRPACGNLLG